MKLTELLTLTAQTATSHKEVKKESFGLTTYRLDVDTETSLTPPEWLAEVGVLLKIDEEGQIDENVLDVAISYKMANIKVLMEVPYQPEALDEDYLITSIATNMQIPLVFLPPKDAQSEVDFKNYLKQVRAVASVLLKKPNLDQMVMPVTNFMEYLFVELLGQGATFEVKDQYVTESFIQTMRPDRVDELKAAIREEIYTHFGSKEAFEGIAKKTMTAFYNEVETIAIEGKVKLETLKAVKEHLGTFQETLGTLATQIVIKLESASLIPPELKEMNYIDWLFDELTHTQILEHLGWTQKQAPYLNESFLKEIKTSKDAEIKQFIQTHLHAHFGSEEQFKKVEQRAKENLMNRIESQIKISQASAELNPVKKSEAENTSEVLEVVQVEFNERFPRILEEIKTHSLTV